MDLEPAETASTRRSLLGAAGLAGLLGTAAAVVGTSSAAAAPPIPDRPTDSDRQALRAALSLELAAAQLYRTAADELDPEIAEIATIMAEQHDAYVASIAGVIGASSSEIQPAPIVDELSDAFATSNQQDFGAVARTLENTAASTHIELLGGYESIDAIDLTASILTVESRHAVVMTSLAGFADNLDEMLGNDADALSLSTGGAA